MNPGWPAADDALARGRGWLAGSAGQHVVVAADRDVDGLSAAVIMKRTLLDLGAASAEIVPAEKGEHIHTASMQARVRALAPDALVVVDMGSRGAPILPGLPTLLVDHHQPHGLPPGATVVSAFGHEPVAATSLLAYELVRPLVAGDDLDTHGFDWLALLGAYADLGSELPFLEMRRALRTYGRASVAEAVALLNAARRTEDTAIALALAVLERAPDPRAIAKGKVAGVDGLRDCRRVVQSELDRCGRAAPRVTGQLAVIRITSPAQIHPLLAARWVRRLRKQIVMVANDGYILGRVNFAMRTELPVNMVELLRALPLDGVAGEFGFGHPKATGGSLAPADFQRLVALLGSGGETAAAASPPR